LPLAIPSALRSSFSGRRRSVHDGPTTPLFEFRLRLGPCPAKPSQHYACSAGSSHGLCFPAAHQASKVHCSRAKACPLRSVLRVWAPSRRFSPFDAVPALFHAGGAHGIRPSELSPLGRFPGVSTRVSPPTVSPSGIPRRPKTSGRPDGPRFLGFVPSRSPSRCSGCLAHKSPDAPLGFAPSRVFRPRPGLGSRRGSSRALCRVRQLSRTRMRLGVSIGPGLASSFVGESTAADEAPLLGFLRRFGPGR